MAMMARIDAVTRYVVLLAARLYFIPIMLGSPIYFLRQDPQHGFVFAPIAVCSIIIILHRGYMAVMLMMAERIYTVPYLPISASLHTLYSKSICN